MDRLEYEKPEIVEYDSLQDLTGGQTTVSR